MADQLLLEGDMQSATDRLLLEGDMTGGTDLLLLEGDMQSGAPDTPASSAEALVSLQTQALLKTHMDTLLT